VKLDFDSAAKEWDSNEPRLKLTLTLADAMLGELALDGTQTVIDFGAGTGVIALKLAEHAQKVIAADSSTGMLDVIKEKTHAAGIDNIDTLLFDIEESAPAGLAADAIVSSMALHHIENTAKAASMFHAILRPGGRIAIADLDSENGDFHQDNTGVAHLGFDREKLASVFAAAGFTNIEFKTAYIMTKPIADGTMKDFPIFLMTADA